MEPSRLDLSSLRNTIAHLQGALAVVGDSSWFETQTQHIRNTLIAGVIQNFEFVYELSVKMIRRELERGSDVPHDIDRLTFRDLMRVAGEKGLIDDVKAWFRHRETRNETSHAYNQTKAMKAAQGAEAFLADAIALLAALEARNA